MSDPRQHNLTHEQVQALLADYTADALTPAEHMALDRHLSACTTCQQALAEVRAIRHHLHSLAADAPQASPSFADAVLARLPQPDLAIHADIGTPVAPRPLSDWPRVVEVIPPDAGAAPHNGHHPAHHPRRTWMEQQRHPEAIPDLAAHRRPYPFIAAALLVALMGVAIFGVLSGRGRPNTIPGSGPGNTTPAPTVSNASGTPQPMGTVTTAIDPKTGLPVDGFLSDVQFRAPNDGYAVGTSASGTLILHYDGQRWNVVPQGVVNGGLAGVAIVSASDVWAVGYNGTKPLILHLSNGGWQQINVPFQGSLEKVRMISPNEGWMLGQSEGGGPFVVHYNQGQWSTLNLSGTNGANDFHGLTALSANDVYISGYGTVLRRQNGGWNAVLTGAPGNLLAIALISPTDGWAGGAGTPPGKRASGFGGVPMLYHYDGTTWTRAPTSFQGTAGNIYALAFASVTAGWAVGDVPGTQTNPTPNSTPATPYPSTPYPIGTPATPYPTPTPNPPGVQANPTSNNSLLLGYANGQWTPAAQQFPVDLYGVALTSPTEGWAIGTHAVFNGPNQPYILRLHNGTWGVYQP